MHLEVAEGLHAPPREAADRLEPHSVETDLRDDPIDRGLSAVCHLTGLDFLYQAI